MKNVHAGYDMVKSAGTVGNENEARKEGVDYTHRFQRSGSHMPCRVTTVTTRTAVPFCPCSASGTEPQQQKMELKSHLPAFGDIPRLLADVKCHLAPGLSSAHSSLWGSAK